LIPFGDGIVALARPTVENVPELAQLGVKRLISEVSLDTDTRRELARAGIDLVNAPIGSTFRYAPAIRAAAAAPGRIAVHCQHGVDRTGATIAYILHCIYGVQLGRAMSAVVAPYENDRAYLDGILSTYAARQGGTLKMEVRPQEVGIYSAAANNGIGGMKARPGGYENLIRTTIEAAQECR
jgi:hypothetical protein